MKADNTRNSFDPIKHFSRVLMQQGRVQLDADWNEQADILLHMLRRLAADVFPNGGGSGFSLTPLENLTSDFIIGSGDYWVDGILCEVESTPVAVTALNAPNGVSVAAWTVDEMPFAVGQYVAVTGVADGTPFEVDGKITAAQYGLSTLTLDKDVTSLQKATNVQLQRLVTYTSQPGMPGALAGGLYQIYLDVWERVVTYLQDDSIREVALNGPDTAARTQVVWQVRAWPMTPPAPPPPPPQAGKTVTRKQTAQLAVSPTCMTVQALSAALRPNASGLLQARTQPGVESTDPCTIAPDSQYRGPENQLYRVEIRTGRTQPGDPAQPSTPATFVWSRENGSVVFPIVKLDVADGTTQVVLGNLGRDDRYGLQIGDYVEIQDDAAVLANAAPPLLQVQAIDRSALMVTLAGNTGTTIGTDPSLHPIVRRWDQEAGDPTTGGLTLVNGAAQIVGDVWLDLEDGVQVRFPNGDASAYQTGDYWLIPARVATGDVIWPTETDTDVLGAVTVYPVAKAPDGIAHHYLPLAIFDTTSGSPVMTKCANEIMRG